MEQSVSWEILSVYATNLKTQPPKEVGGHEFEKVEGCWSCLKRKRQMYAAEKLVISPNGNDETNLKYFKAGQGRRTENQNPCLGHHCGGTKVLRRDWVTGRLPQKNKKDTKRRKWKETRGRSKVVCSVNKNCKA